MVRDSLRRSLRHDKDVEKRVHQLTTLMEITQQLTSTLELEPLLQYILENAVKILDCEAGSLFLVDEATQELVFKVAVGPVAAELVGQRLPAGTGLAGQAVKTRQPSIENDLQHSGRFRTTWDDQTGFITRSLIVVPMQFRDQIIGVIEMVNQHGDRAFTTDDQSLLTVFAGQAAVAIENARLYQEQIQRSRIIEAMADIANEIATSREVLPALEKITHRTAELLGTDGVAIYLLEEDNITLKTVAAYGVYSHELLVHTRKVGEGITGSVFVNAKAEIVNNTQCDPRRVHVPGTPENEEKIESLMSAPLILRGKTIGVINAWRLRENGLFDEVELNFLAGIAHQASICIESGRLFQETKRQAQEAEILRDSLAVVASTLEKDVAIDSILEQLERVVPYDSASVQLIHDGYLEIVGGRRLPESIDQESRRFRIEPGDPAYPILQGNMPYIRYENVRNYTPAFSKPPHEQIIAWLAVPLVLDGRIIGIIALDGFRSGQFTDRHAQLAVTYGSQVSIALENARLYSEMQHELKERKRVEENIQELNISLEKRVEERTLQLQAEKIKIERFAQNVQCLRALTNLLQACLTIEETGEIIADHMRDLFPVTGGSLFLAGEGSTDFVLFSRWGSTSTVDELDPVSCWGIRRSKAHIRQAHDPVPRCSHYKDDLPNESMCLPLFVQGEVIGLICLEREQQENEISFTPEMQNLAIATADSIALALANLRLREKLHNQAIRDPLTGLFNRRYLDETLKRETRRASRSQHPLCVIMFEVDNFRYYNNTFGHDAGDYVLRKIADTMRENLRCSDFPCRYGGDEFTLLLPETTLEAGALRAEQLRKTIEALALSFNNQSLGQVTVRMGVAAYPKHGETGEAVRKVADDASYRARAIGRNCVIVAE